MKSLCYQRIFGFRKRVSANNTISGKNNISEDDLRKLAFVIVECDRENVAENVYDTYGSRIMPYVYEAIQKI